MKMKRVIELAEGRLKHADKLITPEVLTAIDAKLSAIRSLGECFDANVGSGSTAVYEDSDNTWRVTVENRVAYESGRCIMVRRWADIDGDCDGVIDHLLHKESVLRAAVYGDSNAFFAAVKKGETV
jgi:hypothetical protein